MWDLVGNYNIDFLITWLIYFRHMLYTQLEKDPLESFLTRLVNDAVEEASVTVVRETVREMAREYVEYRQVDEVLDDLLDDYLDEIGQELVSFVGLYCASMSQSFIFLPCEPHREKTGFLPMRKQRRRSASR